MIILGIDYGDRKIGLAICDELEISVAAMQLLRIKNENEALVKVLKYLAELHTKEVVIGMPSNWEGKGTRQSLKVKTFAEKLQTKGIKVHLWDENYSTKTVETGLRGKKRKNSDSLAAKLILEEFLAHKQSGI